jgi:CHAD domain-containing protein
MLQAGAKRLKPRSGFADPRVLLAGSLDERWNIFLHQLQRSRRHLSEPAIHDLRVATRRLLSLISMIDSVVADNNLEKVRRQLRRHLKAFNDLRDVHVQLLRVKTLTRRFPQLRSFSADLRVRERRLVSEAGREVRGIKILLLERLLAEELERTLHLFGDVSTRVAGTAVLTGIGGRAFAAAVQRRQAVNPADPRSIHRFRVAFKKFRYTVEILRPQLRWIRKPLFRKMNTYQTAMGEIQDLEVLTASIKAYALRRGQMASLAYMPVYQHLAELRRRSVEEFLKGADQLYEFWMSEEYHR